MTPERLEQLADAWGADLARWPESERTQAQALLGRDAAAGAVLNRPAELDAMLAAHSIEPPDAQLVRAVLASAPSGAQQRVAGKRNGWKFPRNWWWSGASVAGVGL